MPKESPGINDSIRLLDESHKEIIAKADYLYEVLTNLRFEGKVALGRNAAETSRTLEYFHRHLTAHIKIEEIIFSYIVVHIPKLVSAIGFLQAEHKEIKTHLHTLQTLLGQLAAEKNEIKRASFQEKIKDKGIYFVYLLRNHIRDEEESIYKSIAEELRREEKKELQKRIAFALKNGHNKVSKVAAKS